MGEVIDIFRNKKNNKDKKISNDPSVAERISRIKASLSRINQLMSELRFTGTNRGMKFDDKEETL
jgi:hypothetical protein